ncbi:MAG TPA: imidazole glycerol phosphate synthase subunit HisH [Desulfobacterales bacterium]|nr:imidazole glycerol phosphate synthase subunit HisH [Desulfobacterales bacterium]
MKRSVSVVDYGMGNLRSVNMALKHCGGEVRIIDSPDQIRQADRLVLPGVGAFADGMAELQARGLAAAIQEYARRGRPFLGICLGMQMMFEKSAEFQDTAGLSLLPGKIVAIPPTAADGAPHKIPHIGWNRLLIPATGADWDKTNLQGIEPGAAVYFVHSYTAAPDRAADRLADCDYHGRIISAAVRWKNLSGCQFHPEKSGTIGLKILENFLEL